VVAKAVYFESGCKNNKIYINISYTRSEIVPANMPYCNPLSVTEDLKNFIIRAGTPGIYVLAVLKGKKLISRNAPVAFGFATNCGIPLIMSID